MGGLCEGLWEVCGRIVNDFERIVGGCRNRPLRALGSILDHFQSIPGILFGLFF